MAEVRHYCMMLLALVKDGVRRRDLCVPPLLSLIHNMLSFNVQLEFRLRAYQTVLEGRLWWLGIGWRSSLSR